MTPEIHLMTLMGVLTPKLGNIVWLRLKAVESAKVGSMALQ